MSYLYIVLTNTIQISIDIAWNLGVWDKLGKQNSVALVEIVEDSGADGTVIGK